jgi:hypothetical protein
MNGGFEMGKGGSLGYLRVYKLHCEFFMRRGITRERLLSNCFVDGMLVPALSSEVGGGKGTENRR